MLSARIHLDHQECIIWRKIKAGTSFPMRILEFMIHFRFWLMTINFYFFIKEHLTLISNLNRKYLYVTVKIGLVQSEWAFTSFADSFGMIGFDGFGFPVLFGQGLRRPVEREIHQTHTCANRSWLETFSCEPLHCWERDWRTACQRRPLQGQQRIGECSCF